MQESCSYATSFPCVSASELSIMVNIYKLRPFLSIFVIDRSVCTHWSALVLFFYIVLW